MVVRVLEAFFGLFLVIFIFSDFLIFNYIKK